MFNWNIFCYPVKSPKSLVQGISFNPCSTGIYSVT
nr:MAG TPA: hypothetical protein [Caudoviricetes sp.]